MSQVPKPSRRVSLSRTQTQEGLGAELFSLCQGITADGRISKDELIALRQWLRDNKDGQLLGIGFLTEILGKILADGRATHDEQRDLMEAIEKILPPDARKVAKAARRAVEAKRKADEKAARERERIIEWEKEERRSPEDEFDFMVAGVQFEGRSHVIKHYLADGDRVCIVPQPDNPYDEFAVLITLRDGQQIGYVPRDDSEDVTMCIHDRKHYVAFVKKILIGSRYPIPVIVLQFFRPDQLVDIIDLKPDPCPVASHPFKPYKQGKSHVHKPWWKFW